MLYLIGVGLSSIDDITLKGLNIVKKCDYVFIDAYTSILSHGIEEIEKLTGKKVEKASREHVEQSDVLIENATNGDVAFLVVGDPLTATTHLDLLIRCLDANVPVKVLHNASIMNAAGCCGLQLYEYGETVSIPFWDELGKPESFYDKIEQNYRRGLHTLCLLDIKVREKSIKNILKQREIFEPPRFMTCEQAAHQLLQILKHRSEPVITEPEGIAMSHVAPPPFPCLTPDCLVIGLARVGSDDQVVVVSTLTHMARGQTHPESNPTPIDSILNGPLHSLIIPGRLQPLEIQWLTARERYTPLIKASSKTDLRGDALPYVFVSDGEGAAVPVTPMNGDIPVATDESKHKRKLLMDAMFDNHCKHVVKVVIGELP